MRGLLNMVLWKVVERLGKARGGSGLRRRWRKNGRVRQPQLLLRASCDRYCAR
jgi:hypothetical protein